MSRVHALPLRQVGDLVHRYRAVETRVDRDPVQRGAERTGENVGTERRVAGQACPQLVERTAGMHERTPRAASS